VTASPPESPQGTTPLPWDCTAADGVTGAGGGGAGSGTSVIAAKLALETTTLPRAAGTG